MSRGIQDEVVLKGILLAEIQATGESPDLPFVAARAGRIRKQREVEATLAALAEAGFSGPLPRGRRAGWRSGGCGPGQGVAEWGPITGIVHGAGVLADKHIAEKTPEQFDRVLGPKVSGLRSLLEATGDDPLSLMLLFSSASARFGNPGQCDYAAANEVLNKVAASEARRRGERCLVKSFNWGPWAGGGMVSPALEAHFRERGITLLTREVGVRIFVEEILYGDSDSVEILIGGVQTPLPRGTRP